MKNGTLSDLLASVKVARSELEYASAGLASQRGFESGHSNVGCLETMLTSLCLARTALATAQSSFGDSTVADSTRRLTMAMS